MGQSTTAYRRQPKSFAKLIIQADGDERTFELREKTGIPVTVYAYMGDELTLQLAYDKDQIESPLAEEALNGLEDLVVRRKFDEE